MQSQLIDLLWSVGAGGVTYSVISGGPLVKSLWAKALSAFRGSGTSVAKDDDHADLDAVKRLSDRAERRKAPPLKKAVRDVEVNFFSQGDSAKPK